MRELIQSIHRKMGAIGLAKYPIWDDVLKAERPMLYAGSVNENRPQYATHYGLTLTRESMRDILCDLRAPLPVSDCSIDAFQSEDVFEHIEYDDLAPIFAEIHRALKIDGLFRLSVPDYRCPIMLERSIKNAAGELLFDPGGGGAYENGRIVNGGHVWFPTYESVKMLFDASPFRDVQYLHYTAKDGNSVLNKIDYSLGYIKRTRDHDERASSPLMSLSIVVDARK